MEKIEGEGVLDRSVVSQHHRVRRTFGPAQYCAAWPNTSIPNVNPVSPSRYIYIYMIPNCTQSSKFEGLDCFNRKATTNQHKQCEGNERGGMSSQAGIFRDVYCLPVQF